MTMRYIPHGSGYVIDTGKCLIGRANTPQPPRIVSRDAERIQAALLDARTARPLSLMHRVFGAIWRWA